MMGIDGVGGNFEITLGWVWVGTNPNYHNQLDPAGMMAEGMLGQLAARPGLGGKTPHGPMAQPLPVITMKKVENVRLEEGGNPGRD